MRAKSEFIPPEAGRGWSFQVRTADAFPFGWHVHDEYELTAITSGTGRIFVGDATVSYAPGHVALVGPRLPHSYASFHSGGPNTAYVAHFRSELIDRLLGEEEFRPVHRLMERASSGVAVPAAPAEVRDALLRLGRSTGARQTLALFDVLAELAESTNLVMLSSHAATEAPSATLRRVTGYVERNFERPLSREEIAAAVALSASSVSRLVRRELGTTVTGYVTHIRLGAASRALVATDRPVADIAFQCGFASLANFNRHFRGSRGMTPRDYRRAFRADQTALGSDVLP